MTLGARFEFRIQTGKKKITVFDFKGNFSIILANSFFSFFAKVGNLSFYIPKKEMITGKKGSQNDDFKNITSENGIEMERWFFVWVFTRFSSPMSVNL